MWTHALALALYAGAMIVWAGTRQPLGIWVVKLAGIVVLGHAVEALGVRFGWPFGRYHYSPVLGFKIVGVPWVMGLAWYTASVSALGTARCLTGTETPPWIVRLLGALLILALDIVLEPAAFMVHRYWIWDGGVIPARNYLSWFVIAWFLISFLDRPPLPDRTEDRFSDALPFGIYAMLWLLFACTDLVHGVSLPVLSSSALAGFSGAAAFLARKRDRSIAA
jgi:putative membrane protein